MTKIIVRKFVCIAINYVGQNSIWNCCSKHVHRWRLRITKYQQSVYIRKFAAMPSSSVDSDDCCWKHTTMHEHTWFRQTVYGFFIFHMLLEVGHKIISDQINHLCYRCVYNLCVFSSFIPAPHRHLFLKFDKQLFLDSGKTITTLSSHHYMHRFAL